MVVSWDILLVLLSVLIAVAGTFVTLQHAQRIYSCSGRSAKLWAARSGITLAVTIWSAHFIGMLALTLPVRLYYDLALTLLSLLPVLAGSLLGFNALCAPASERRIIFSGLLMGLGISDPNYLQLPRVHEGNDLNTLLQNYWMVIHIPPL